MAAGGAATMADCAAPIPTSVLVSNVDPPEELIPGKSLYYASTCRECPAGCGLHVCTRDGRAVKIEGNPHHPVNQGAQCARGQAGLQGLYDPDRLTQPLRRVPTGGTEPMSWDEAMAAVADSLSEVGQERDPQALVCVSGTLGPTLSSLTHRWMDTLGGGHLIEYEAFGYEFLKAANQHTFGREEVPEFALERASFVLSLGTDFLETWLSPVEFSRGLSAVRTYSRGAMGRLVQVESRLSLTGANADDWILIRPGTEHALVLGLMNVILTEGLAVVEEAESSRIEQLVAPFDPQRVSQISGIPSDAIYNLARSFARQRPSLALFGGVACTAPNATATQVAVNLLNYIVGNVGETVRFGADLYPGRLQSYQDMVQLVDDMNAGTVKVLVVHDTNPAFTLPADAGFREALANVPLVVALSAQMTETASLANVVLPIHTPLEVWDDYSPRAGVTGLQQPVMQPVHDTRHAGDILLELDRRLSTSEAGSIGAESYYQFLRARWRELQARERPDLEFEPFWKLSVMGGGVWQEFVPQSPALSADWPALGFEEPLPSDDTGEQGLALIPYPSIFHFDGRGANKSWLQEVPHPLTDVAWDTYAEIHPETAESLGLQQGDIVQIRSPHGEISLPVFLQRWIHREALAVPLGQGHTEYGRYAQGRGANPVELLSSAAEPGSGGLSWLSVRIAAERTDRRYQLVSTRGELSQGGREIAQTISLAELATGATEDADAAAEHGVADLYPAHPHPEHSWGMVIDLNACIGCRVCEVACYAENNIRIMGKEQMALGRELSWIRIESYAEETPTPGYTFLPMLCQQCHNAPCESVCPVFATYHNPEGLNAQIYNRCVGTRYCAANCPYKARRFNYFSPKFPEPLDRQLNPNVTVRDLGVMEKCTFCVQRLVEGKQRAEDQSRELSDADVVPACAQACPTRAIVFGDSNNSESLVSQRSRDARAYHVLEHLNTKPAVTYLKRIRHRSETA
jgi:molybdopterin-containing oxidoreductase family iron-sulfur binding subunit